MRRASAGGRADLRRQPQQALAQRWEAACEEAARVQVGCRVHGAEPLCSRVVRCTLTLAVPPGGVDALCVWERQCLQVGEQLRRLGMRQKARPAHEARALRQPHRQWREHAVAVVVVSRRHPLHRTAAQRAADTD